MSPAVRRDEFDRGGGRQLTRLGWSTWDDAASPPKLMPRRVGGVACPFVHEALERCIGRLIAVRGMLQVQLLPFLHPPALVAAPKLFIG